MRVELAYAEPAREVLIAFDVPAGSSVLDCVERSGLLRLVPRLHDARLGFAVFGRRVEPTDPVGPGDRIEVLRPLRVDPKEARRRRARRGGGPRPGADPPGAGRVRRGGAPGGGRATY